MDKPEMAFPQAECGPSGGMTTRDVFAAFALAGIIAAEGESEFSADYAALRAYRLANAMMEMRSK